MALIVADGLGNEVRDEVAIHDVGASSGRLDRMWGGARRVLAKAREIDADLYHFHDPELLPAGLQLKRMGKRVVFDAHEDVPLQILGKPYLGPVARQLVSRAFAAFESRAAARFDAIVAATPAIRGKFATMNPVVVDINNFPLPGELVADPVTAQERRDVCYVGGITEIRGVLELVSAMGRVRSPARLKLCGTFAEPEVAAAARRDAGWARVDEMGQLTRDQVRHVLSGCFAGIVTFHPLPNHVEAQPNKMFEYMSAGVPVIASDFPLWREVVLENNCGTCVDPRNADDIARAIDTLANDPALVAEMGEKGRSAVRDRFNWTIEEAKLLDLYASLLSRGDNT
ncbi:MAG: glycosyltransferase family 4 protein [Burkholderiaceae bacterium]|nr:glycosyltransferase family 4 protein [Burkholderiaceae bacterium]